MLDTMEGPIDDSAMYDLLGRYLAGECSPAEAAHVDEWRAASPENQQTLEALQAIWGQATAPDAQSQAREDAAWDRLRMRMQSQTGEAEAEEEAKPFIPQPKPSVHRAWLWRIAALLVVGLSIGIVFYLNQLRQDPMQAMLSLSAGETSISDTLPDGTLVTLNAHSRLDYPAQFAAGERRVSLAGEAFFEVAHDAANPFRILAGAADVRVLGTSFNLSTRGEQVRVAVVTGKVELTQHDSLAQQPRAKLLLTAGMTGSYDGKRKTMRQEQGESENAQFWRTGKLVFRDAPMQHVLDELNAVLDDSIALGNPALATCRLSTSFSRPSIDSVIAVIAETFDLQVTHNGKIYQLDGAACE